MGLLYKLDTDTTILDGYIDPEIMGNVLNDRIHYIQRPENNIIINVNNTYKFRPERLAYEQYGNEQLYPIILAVNNIGSLLDFDPALFNNNIKLLKPEIIKNIFNI